jgi:hypothetical protein
MISVVLSFCWVLFRLDGRQERREDKREGNTGLLKI